MNPSACASGATTLGRRPDAARLSGQGPADDYGTGYANLRTASAGAASA
ncbi:hypothetical protein [Massilia horti]|nr:hypothetical protein [Massilia horti]